MNDITNDEILDALRSLISSDEVVIDENSLSQEDDFSVNSSFNLDSTEFTELSDVVLDYTESFETLQLTVDELNKNIIDIKNTGFFISFCLVLFAGCYLIVASFNNLTKGVL